MSNLAVSLGNRIKILRQGLGLSQEALAYKAGLSPAHLGQIERAVKNPTIDTIEKISLALDVPVHELFADLDCIHTNNQNITLNKINAHLLSMSEPEQKDFLKILRIIKHFPSHE